MRFRELLLLFTLVFQTLVVCAQNTEPVAVLMNSHSYFDLSLEQSLDYEISVAYLPSQFQMEWTSSMALFTELEIKASGARELMDLLNLVSGFNFGGNVEGIVGLAVRGNWAHEGKALLLIEGLEMNENLFSTLQFGNHYPVTDIKGIEIIGNSGSAMYKGIAELPGTSWELILSLS